MDEKKFLMCHYTQENLSEKEMEKLINNKELFIDVKNFYDESYTEADSKKLKFIQAFSKNTVKEYNSDLVFLDRYLSLCVLLLGEILNEKKIYDGFITWATPSMIRDNDISNENVYSVEPIKNFITDAHVIGVMVDHRFKNLYEAFISSDSMDIFMEKDSKIYLNFSNYITTDDNNSLIDLKEKYNSDYFIFK